MDDHAARINWADAPDPDGGVYYEVVTPKPGKDLALIVLSEAIVGVVTYYVPAASPGEKGQSKPCTCSEKPCPGRLADRDHRWKGYLACWDRPRGRLVLAEVTKEAYSRCPQFEVYKGALRGKVIRLVRNGIAANARVLAKVEEPRGQPFELPPAFNVRSALERIWNCHFTPPRSRRKGEERPRPGPDGDESGVSDGEV